MNTEADRVDVAVIGCGTTGLALARLLQLEGLRVALIDRSRLPMARPRATHVDDETMRAFQTLGLAHLEKDFSLVGIYRHYDARWRVVMQMALNRGLTDQGWQSDYMFHQPDFESVLRGHAHNDPGTSTWFGWEVTEVHDTGDEVRLALRERATGEERQVVAAYLVGCDGANSRVREIMGCRLEDHRATHRQLIVDIIPFVTKEALSGRDSFIQAGIRNPLTFVPIAAPRVRFELMLRPEDTDAEFERTEKAYEILSPWLSPDEYRLLRCDVYQWHSLTADPWRVGRLLIAGDAAHTMPPHLGQGMCSGIRDAQNLAWKLARVVRGQSDEGLLDTYESERRPHVVTYTTLSAQLANTVETLEATEEEPPVLQPEPLRPRLGPGVWDEADDLGGRLSEQPRLSDGRLLDDAVGYRFAVVGDPATVAGLSERSRSLLTALDARIVEDFTGDVRSWVVGQGATAVLVRPDRYLAGTADDPAELDALVEQVAGALLPAAVSA